MGNLVDTYVITPKHDVDEKGIHDDYIDRSDSEILEMVTDDIDRAFLTEVFSQGCQVIDLFQRLSEIPEPVWKLIEEYEEKHQSWKFVRRYRQDSLIQRLRKQFFTTLLIVENDYDPDKQNRFVIVRSDELIHLEPQPAFKLMTEEQFSATLPEDQAFCQKVITPLAVVDVVILNCDQEDGKEL
ncbi:MAG: hypothetical protein WCX65_05030 [bacterium]